MKIRTLLIVLLASGVLLGLTAALTHPALSAIPLEPPTKPEGIDLDVLYINRTPRYRRYEWSWRPADGLPNQYEVDRILELQNDRHSPPGDFGYSGWVQLADGTVFCVAHYRGDADLSYVTETWIREAAFAAGPE